MRTTKVVVVGGCILTLMLGGLKDSPAVRRLDSLHAALTSASGAGACYAFKEFDRGFTSKMNAERSKKGEGSLKLDAELSRVAIKHTRDMIKNWLDTGDVTLYHMDAGVRAKLVTKYSILGENVGVVGSVDSLHEGFMNSPSHRRNILSNEYKFVGVGTKVKKGLMWVTEIFEATANPGSPLC